MEMKVLSQDMEDRIMLSASRLFVLKGKAGTSMQDIANEAGINRTLLNYYFRSKENLFERVFLKVFSKFLPDIVNTLNSESPVFKKLEGLIDYYFEMLIDNPFIPLFIIQELSSDPRRLIDSLKNGGLNVKMLLVALEDEMKKGNIRGSDPKEIIVNLMALIIFPFLGRNIIQEIVFSGDDEAYSSFLNKRKNALKTSFFNSLKP